ncbi:hypothetical protein IAU60_003745 [Kwoniella sp. DSM 27419]
MVTTMRQWKLVGRESYDQLKVEKDQPVPQAVSLNYRDISIVRNTYPFELKDVVVPISDAAGTVAEVGSRVSKFKKGDKVMPTFHQQHQPGAPSLGGPVDGVAREYLAVSELDAVLMPKDYSFVEAATLPCAALTAWDSFYGLEGRTLTAGDWVLTQGTGAAGATVVATTSSADKAEKLKALGADHVINYKEDSNWGKTARGLTPGGSGFQHVIEIGGPGTLKHSVDAIAAGGVISIIGLGIFVGNRSQMEAMVRAINSTGLKPVVDDKVFEFDQLPEAYQHMEAQKHIGKVVVKF